MKKQKITAEYLEARIDKAKQTRKNLKKSKKVKLSLSIKNLIGYCDDTIIICEALLKKL